MSSRERKAKPDPSLFLKKVLPWVIEKKIKKIAYWGGEPIVYWKTIKTIQDAFDEAGHEFDMIKMATNGTLFTEEHVKQCNKWGVYTILSQHLDYGVPAWDHVMKLDRMSLSYLFHHDELYAWDWLERCRDLEERYQRQVFPFMHWPRSTDGANKSSDLTHEDLDKHIVHLWELADLARKGDRYAKGLWYAHWVEWKEKLRPGEEAVPMCYGDHQIDIDLDGNRYGCHHTVEPWIKTGTVWDDQQNPKALQQVRRFVDTDECMSCPIKTWCRGNCHLSRTHDEDCRLSKYKHKILTWLDPHMEVSGERIYKHD
jgi:radical SAM protein with 4Fe4S-binding SPASM domain